MISVVIPLYNKEKQIAHTLQTVLNQTFKDFEIIIVNDGSTDNSVSEVEKIQDSRIKIIHQANAGVAAARNHGIEDSSYELISFLDADDEWKPTYLETQYHLSQKYPDCDVFACNYEFQDNTGTITNTTIKKLPFNGSDGILSNYFEIAACSHPPLWTSAVMARKDALNSIGGFPFGVKSGEDLLTWAKLVTKYKVAYCTKPLSIYRIDNEFIPPRRQDIGDPVGKGLIELLHAYNPPYLRQYISHWHKMRASVAIRFGEKKETLKESFLALYYNPLNYKILPFFVLPILPDKICKRIIRHHKS